MINAVKKYLSLVMAIAVMLSAIACVPVFAADDEAVSGLISSSSYYFIDFETGDDTKNTSHFSKYHGVASFAIHNEGAGGSAKSLKWTEGHRLNNGAPATASHCMFKPNGTTPSFTVPAGYSVKYSFKLKLAQRLTAGHISVQTVINSGSGNQYPKIWYTTFDNNETEKWQNISFVYTNTGSTNATFSIGELLFDNNKDANATTTEGNYVIGYTSDNYGTRTYYFDDVEFGLFAPEAMLSNNVSNTPNYENYYVNYENLPSNVANGSNAYYVKAYSSGYASLADISANGSGHSLKVDPTGSAAGKLQMVTLGGNIRPKALKKGDTVTVAFDLKLGSAVADGEIATLLRENGGTYGAYFGNSNAHYFSGLDKTNTKTWQHFELSFTATEDKANDMFDISVHFYKEGATNTGWTFVEGAADPFVYVDNLTLFIDRAAYPKTGVSVSNLSAQYNAVGETIDVDYTFNPSATGATDNSIIRLVAKDRNGVYSSLASTTAGNAIIAPATAPGKKLYIEVIAADSTGCIGKTYRTFVINSDSYYLNDFESGATNLSGGSHHKPVITEGGAYGSKYCTSLSVDDYNYGSPIYAIGTPNYFSFEAKAGDVLRGSMLVKLTTPQAESSLGKCSLLLWSEQVISNERKYHFITTTFDKTETDWQKINFTYTFNKDFVDNKATAEVNEAITKMELRMNGGSANNISQSETTACSYLIDDLEIYLDKSHDTITPTVSNLKQTGEFKVGESIGLVYDFNAADGETDISSVKLMAGDGTVGACVVELAPGETVTITKDMLGKTYYWEVVPISSSGYVGEKAVLLATKPEYADIIIYNFEDNNTQDVEGATVTSTGFMGTKGLSVATDSVALNAVIDPSYNYKISAKVKATTAPTASFSMGDGTTFINSAMTVASLGDNWYSLTLDNYNFNAANSTSYTTIQVSTYAKITFGTSGSYVLDDIMIMPASLTESSDVTVSLPANAKIFETVNATISKKGVYYVFEISDDGINWATISTGIATATTIPYDMDATIADKKLRMTVYTTDTAYQYKTSNTLTENTEEVISTGIKVTNAKGEEVTDVSDGYFTTTATVYNPFDKPAQITLYNAVYTSVPYKLAYVKPYKVSVPKGITVITDTIDLTNVSHYSEYTHLLKTFLWNEYIPLADAYELAACELIDGAVYNMHIDPSIETVEGIVMMNRHGESGAFSESDSFRAFCKERNLAIFDFYDGTNGQLKWFHDEQFAMNVLNTKIAEFAQTTGHPELNYVPIATLGHSNGCYSAGKIAQLNPERTFAVLCFKSAYGRQFEYDELIEAGVPVFAVTGEVDWSWGYHDQIHAAERMVAKGGVVTYLQQPGAGHGNMSSVEAIMLAFLDEAYKAKVKNATVSNGTVTMTDIDVESGYIGYGEYTEEVESVWIEESKTYEDRTVYKLTNPQYMTYAEYKTKPAGFKAQAWLFNENFAEKWENFVNSGSIN